MCWSRTWNLDKARGRKQRIFYCTWEKTCLFGTGFKPSKSHKELTADLGFKSFVLYLCKLSSIPPLSRTSLLLLALKCQKTCWDPELETGPQRQFSHVLHHWVLGPGTLTQDVMFRATEERRKRWEVQTQRQTVWNSYSRMKAQSLKVIEEETGIWWFLDFFSF